VSFCRRYVPHLVGIWIALQFGTTVAASVILHASGGSAVEIVCQCPGTTQGATCPMHRGHSRNHDRTDNDSERCTLKNALGVSDIALFAWLTGGGILVAEPQLTVPDGASAVLRSRARASDRLELPDAPPPRL
jgi:hypothetical protein